MLTKYKPSFLIEHQDNYETYIVHLNEEMKGLFNEAIFFYNEIEKNFNHEVYDGVVMLNDKIVLSHESIYLPFAFNIHGHDHSNKVSYDDGLHLNVCAEHINYTPVSLNELIKNGHFKDVPSIHRITIDKASDKHR